MEKDKIRFKDLSWPLKTATVISFIVGAVWCLAFLYGFFLGMTGI